MYRNNCQSLLILEIKVTIKDVNDHKPECSKKKNSYWKEKQKVMHNAINHQIDKSIIISHSTWHFLKEQTKH